MPAFDAQTTPWARVNSGTSMTVAHTCSWTNRCIVVNVGTTGNLVTGVTYGGVSMTQVWSYSADGAWNGCTAWYLANPASGSNNVVISTSSATHIMCQIASYTSVNQSTPVGASVTNWPTSTTSFTQTVTTTVNNSWLVGLGKGRNGSTITAGSNTFVRANVEILFTGLYVIDSNSAQTPTGSKSMNVTSASQEFNGTMFELIDIWVTERWQFFQFF